MRFLTAGESHGPKLVGIIEGMPSGVGIDKNKIDESLRRRQKGPGRGGRMSIERDEVHIVSGVRGGVTTGSPVALEILNRDWANWEKIMAFGAEADLESRKVQTPRPGHADLTGALKYRTEVRNILERASARETAMRVAVGCMAMQLLSTLQVTIRGRVLSIGGISAKIEDTPEYWERVKASDWSLGDPEAEERAWKLLEEARGAGESLGGILEIQAHNLPAGLGSHVQWDRKLDGKIAQAIMSVQAIKGVEIGMGFEAGNRPGSQVHDPILFQAGNGYSRASNHAGGIEGGMTNGEPVIVRAVMKPIPTLYHPLQTVHMETKETVQASVERSDICAVPAALVVLEHVLAWTLAEAVLEKFCADSFAELKGYWDSYRNYLKTV